MKESILNVPNLRFPGFEGEWEKHFLVDIVDRVTRKNKAMETNRPLTISAQFGLIDQIDFFKKTVASQDLSSYYLLLNGEFAYNKSYSSEYPWGAIKRLDLYDKGALSSLYICFKPKGTIDSDYLVHYFESSKWHQGMANIAGEGARNHGLLNIAIPDFFNTIHYLPNVSEQRKIADFLNLVEERIAVQNKVIEDYTTLEKEIQHQVFSRINAPHVPLSSISERVSERNSALESDNVLTISAREGLVSQLEFFNKSVASENLSNYYLLRKGDFAYNKSYSSDYPWGAIKHLERYDTGVLSPLYFCFRPNKEIVDTRYLQFFFDTKLWHMHIADIAVEGARNHGLLNMTVGDFYTMPILLPTLKEQKAIAEKLSAIRRKKVAEESIYRLFLQQKRYLLEKLFV